MNVRRLRLLPVGLVALCLFAGCQSMVEPSAAVRQAAAERGEAVFGADLPRLETSVFVTVSDDAPFTPELSVRGDLPLRHGDSGGALLTAAGEVIGVTSSYKMPWITMKLAQIACLPSPDRVRAIIDRDRAQRGATSP